MKTAYQNICRLLKPLGLYRLNGNTLIDKELFSYSAAIDLVDSRLEKINQEAFIQTAIDKGLEVRENLLGLPPKKGVDLKSRREMLIYCFSLMPSDFNLEGMKRSLLAFGLVATIVEDKPGERLVVIVDECKDPAYDLIEENARRMLPSHLDIEFDIGNMTFDLWDQLDLTFSDKDALDYTWNQYDTYMK